MPLAPGQALAHRSISRLPGTFLGEIQTFPDVLWTKLRWSKYGTLETAAGTATSQVFRLSSLYDPDFTGAGSQPRYYDTLCAASGGSAPYGYYRVRKCHYRVTFVNNNTTSATASLGFVQPYFTNTLSATCTLDKYFDAPNCDTVVVSANTNPNMSQVVEGTIDIARFLGIKDIEDEQDLWGAYNSNPAVNVFLNVGVRAQDDTQVGTIRYIVQLVWEVDFFDLYTSGDS
jgi:hypothetical protein